MLDPETSTCLLCKHNNNLNNGNPRACKAFPKGIPEAAYSNTIDENGLLYPDI